MKSLVKFLFLIILKYFLQVTEVGKLTFIIKDSEAQRAELKKKYEFAVSDRDN